MQARKIIASVNENAPLLRLGTLANLLFDRLLTITDDAGLCPGEPKVVWGRLCAEIPKVEVGHVEIALNKLVESEFLYRRSWNARVVLCFKPETFQKIQGFRKDYKRRFAFGELSQVVWEQGLHGFRSAVERVPAGNVATVSVSVSDTGVAAKAAHNLLDTSSEPRRTAKPKRLRASNNGVYSDEFKQFYAHYPRKVGPGDAWNAFRKLTPQDQKLAIEQSEAYGEAWERYDAHKLRRQFCPHPSTWLNKRKFEESHEAYIADAKGTG